MSLGNARTSNARLLKAVAAETEQAPDWMQVGKKVYSPRHGTGIITHLLGKRVFVEFGSPSDTPAKRISYPSWRHILERGILRPSEEAVLRRQFSLPALRDGSLQNDQSQEFLSDQLVKEFAQITHPLFQEIAFELAEKIQAVEVMPATVGTKHPLPTALHPDLNKAMIQLGRTTMYSHQAETFEALHSGQDVLLATPTASGKTLGYNLAVINHCLNDPVHTALYLFPLKALALDQVGKLQEIMEQLPPDQQLKAGVMTGDTPRAERQRLFSPRPPQILCTSPDLLHFHLRHVGNRQSQYETWWDFLRNLKFVVVDEAHTYTAGFGAHFANLMRRLRLAVDRVGGNSNAMQFIFSTATIGNPAELAMKFSGRETQPERLHLITQSSATTPERTLLCLKPSDKPNVDAAEIVVAWLQKNLSGIVFLNTRTAAKKLLAQVQATLKKAYQSNLGHKVIIFHGSLPDERRREIIDRLRAREVQVILSTSALEAGIDIPALDCCLIRGYPGSIMAFHQRKGRAGRRDAGLVIFLPVAQNLLDYYFGKNPHELLHGPVESAMFNADYPIVLAGHLQCACCESRIPSSEVKPRFGTKAGVIADELLDQGRIQLDNRSLQLWTRGRPHGEVNLRGSAADTFKLINHQTGEEFEEMSREIAYREAHPGAIYAAQELDGQVINYRCEALDLERKTVDLQPFANDKQFTQPHTDFKVKLLDHLRDPLILRTTIPEGRIRLTWGWGEILESVDGYTLFSTTYAATCIDTRCKGYHKPLKASKCPHCGCVTKLAEVTEVLGEETFDPPYFTFACFSSSVVVASWCCSRLTRSSRQCSNTSDVPESSCSTRS